MDFKLLIILILININIVIGGTCPPEDVILPCECASVRLIN